MRLRSVLGIFIRYTVITTLSRIRYEMGKAIKLGGWNRFVLSSMQVKPAIILSKECGRNKLPIWRRMIVRIKGATTGA